MDGDTGQLLTPNGPKLAGRLSEGGQNKPGKGTRRRISERCRHLFDAERRHSPQKVTGTSKQRSPAKNAETATTTYPECFFRCMRIHSELPGNVTQSGLRPLSKGSLYSPCDQAQVVAHCVLDRANLNRIYINGMLIYQLA